MFLCLPSSLSILVSTSSYFYSTKDRTSESLASVKPFFESEFISTLMGKKVEMIGVFIPNSWNYIQIASMKLNFLSIQTYTVKHEKEVIKNEWLVLGTKIYVMNIFHLLNCTAFGIHSWIIPDAQHLLVLFLEAAHYRWSNVNTGILGVKGWDGNAHPPPLLLFCPSFSVLPPLLIILYSFPLSPYFALPLNPPPLSHLLWCFQLKTSV